MEESDMTLPPETPGDPEREEAERQQRLRRRRVGLTVRLCAALVLLALAFVLRQSGGEAVREAVAGALREEVSVTECFAELGRAFFGLFTDAGNGET